MKKVGIMGGTFNPIHYAHLLLAEYAYEQFCLEKIVFLPSKQPAYKPNHDLVAGNHRIEMMRLAISDNSHFTYSTIEFDREGNTYTADTLEYLTKKYTDTEFYFIIGADSLFELEHWYQPEKVFSLSHLLVAERDVMKKKQVQKKISEYVDKYHASIDYLELPKYDISSHLIRERVKKGKSIRYLVPKDVIDYIEQHHFYEMGEEFHE